MLDIYCNLSRWCREVDDTAVTKCLLLSHKVFKHPLGIAGLSKIDKQIKHDMFEFTGLYAKLVKEPNVEQITQDSIDFIAKLQGLKETAPSIKMNIFQRTNSLLHIVPFIASYSCILFLITKHFVKSND